MTAADCKVQPGPRVKTPDGPAWLLYWCPSYCAVWLDTSPTLRRNDREAIYPSRDVTAWVAR